MSIPPRACECSLFWSLKVPLGNRCTLVTELCQSICVYWCILFLVVFHCNLNSCFILSTFLKRLLAMLWPTQCALCTSWLMEITQNKKVCDEHLKELFNLRVNFDSRSTRMCLHVWCTGIWMRKDFYFRKCFYIFHLDHG